jgi:hypothetical protein
LCRSVARDGQLIAAGHFIAIADKPAGHARPCAQAPLRLQDLTNCPEQLAIGRAAQNVAMR